MNRTPISLCLTVAIFAFLTQGCGSPGPVISRSVARPPNQHVPNYPAILDDSAQLDAADRKYLSLVPREARPSMARVAKVPGPPDGSRFWVASWRGPRNARAGM